VASTLRGQGEHTRAPGALRGIYTDAQWVALHERLNAIYDSTEIPEYPCLWTMICIITPLWCTLCYCVSRRKKLLQQWLDDENARMADLGLRWVESESVEWGSYLRTPFTLTWLPETRPAYEAIHPDERQLMQEGLPFSFWQKVDRTAWEGEKVARAAGLTAQDYGRRVQWRQMAAAGMNPLQLGLSPPPEAPSAGPQQQSMDESSGNPRVAGGAASAGAVPSAGTRLEALFDFHSDDAEDLSFKEGDVILMGARVDDNWWNGTMLEGGRMGIFPAKRVRVAPTAAESAAAASAAALAASHLGCVRALHDFEGRDSSELSFRTGDIIRLLACGDDGWWRGSFEGREGIFPHNRTEKCEDEPPQQQQPQSTASSIDVQPSPPSAAAATSSTSFAPQHLQSSPSLEQIPTAHIADVQLMPLQTATVCDSLPPSSSSAASLEGVPSAAAAAASSVPQDSAAPVAPLVAATNCRWCGGIKYGPMCASCGGSD
jgi:hypothetical protein